MSHHCALFVLRALLTLACYGTLGEPALAQSSCLYPHPPQINFLMRKPPVIDTSFAKPEVVGGSIAHPADWPATLLLCVSDGNFCTSTAIGLQVILTAAHCFDGVRSADGSPVLGFIQLQQDAQTTNVRCLIHPSYKSFDRTQYDALGMQMQLAWSADIAVCFTDAQVAITKFERINIYSDRVKPHDQVTLLGLGCTLPGGGGAVQTLYQGPAPVKEVQSNTYFIHTVRDPGTVAKEAALCKGDSGGGSFKSFSGFRLLIGINSLADNKIESWLTDVSRDSIQQFLRQEAAHAGVQICGVDLNAQRCG